MIVDVHAHYSSQRYNKTLLRIGGRSLPEAARANTRRQLRADDPNAMSERFERMQDAGVRLQVLSPAASPPYAEKETDAIEAAAIVNDDYATLAQHYPDKLAAFVSLPLPHIDASLREMERGLDQLGMLGVTINCSCFDRSTAEEEFEPLYAEMNRRGAVCFYHPVQNGICSPLINDYGFTVSVGASLEDTAIVLHLIGRKMLEKYPNIKFIVPHLGGLIPMQLYRLDNQMSASRPDLPEKPSATARRIFYDTVGHGSPAALICAWHAFGAGQLVTGSDYPVLMPFESYKRTFEYISECGLPAADVDRILHKNAATLLNLG
ncbi:MAG TPA: amidohydrolase family protein [Dehalococcoidia bacterium]|nr:amidohydrolase family protein [Dehalococcoidia bacterium]